MKKKLLPLFLSQSLRGVAVSLLSFFSAVYLYRRTGSFPLVFIFFLILYLCKIIGTCLAENLALKFGLKKQVVIGHFLTVLCLLAFALSKNIFLLLWLAAAFWGLAIGFFWFGRHGLVIKVSEEGKYGQALGFSSVLDTVFHLGLPLLGGLIISQFGYQVLFSFSLGFVFLALLTLAPLKEEKTHSDVAFREVLHLLFSHPRVTATYLSLGAVGTIYSEALVLYVFLNIQKELGLGIYFTLSMILVALMNYLIGHLVDYQGKKNFIVTGAILSVFVWLGRFFSGSYKSLFVFDVLGKISGSMIGFPLEVLSYEKAVDGHSTGRAILFREIAITFGSILAIILLLVLVLLNLPLRIAFLLAIPFALAKFLIIKKEGILGDESK